MSAATAKASRSRRSRKHQGAQVSRSVPAGLIVPRRVSRQLLLTGASAVVMMLAASQGAYAAKLGYASQGVSAATNAAATAITSAQQAAALTQQSMQSLVRATQAIQAMQSVQNAARNAALGSSGNVPNGLGAGGLQVAPNVGSDPTLWQNANLPTQSTSNGQTNVTVVQKSQKAILTWSSFNVGANTLLYFNQSGGNASDGTNNWIALNRVIDPSGVPSQILGQIKAEGSVYLINANGIIFGGGSQVDVHTLIASSLPFMGENITGLIPGSAAYDTIVNGSDGISGTNGLFLNAANGGIAAPESTGSTRTQAGNLVLGLGSQLTGAAASSYVLPGSITIQAGASISTHANGTGSDGGFVLIAAPNVSNAGTITSTDGQTILAAGIGVSLLQSTTQWLVPELTGRINIGGVDVTPAGSLVNTGLIQAETGNVTLLGSNVTLAGVVGVTTSVSRPGSIVISTVDEADIGDVAPNVPADRRAGQLVVSGLIANLPEEDGQTVPSDGGSFVAGSVNLTGGSVWLQNGSLIEAPGASVGVTALTPGLGFATQPPGDTAVQGRIYVDNGATVDVAGLADVELPMSNTLVTIPLVGANELADSPLLRNSFLNGLKNVVIDSTLSGTNADGEAWVGSPILNASGYVALIPRTIDELLTNGGSITLSGGQVMTATGSSLNLDGGYVHYLGGMVNTTLLIDAYGRIVDIGQADPYVPIIGVAGQFTVDHSHWGVTDTWSSSFLSQGYFEPDYIQGGNAGTLSIFGAQAVVLDGAMSAQAFAGLKQVEAGLAPSGTSPGGNFLPQGGSFILGAASAATEGIGDTLNGESGSVIIQNEAPQLSNLSPGFSATTPLDANALNALGPNDPNNILAWTTVPAVPLENGGFANVTVKMNSGAGGSGPIVVAQGSSLTVQPGGSITLAGQNAVTVLGDLTATSGTISITSNGDITVGPGAVISTAGEWVNDDSLYAGTAGASTYVNGGSISLATAEGVSGSSPTTVVDTTGSILLQAGSVLDVSSGGVLLPTGALLMQNGIPVGKGGNVTLETYAGSPYSSIPLGQPVHGHIAMDGVIESAGFSGGGMLTLQALGFQIGGDPTQAPSWDLYLPTDFFATQGFGGYQLNAVYDATVANGATVRLTQQNLIPDMPALRQSVSGSDLNQGGLTTLGTLDPFHREATNLIMTGGAYRAWGLATGQLPPQYAGVTGAVTIGEGASIMADAGANIGLGSPTQVTVLGSIIAHGGSITLSADSIGSYGFDQAGQITFGTGYTTTSKSVWLGADAVLDVSGVALIDPFAAPVRLGNGIAQPVTGKVLDGGAVVLSDDSGYVVAEAGSTIDVSGVAATFDLPQATVTGGLHYSAQPVWSNAGSITLGAASGLYFDGTLEAHAGAPQGEGGTLIILPETINNNVSQATPGGTVRTTQPDGTPATADGAIALILQQSGDFVPAGATPGQAFTNAPNGVLRFAVDRLGGSGVATLIIGGATATSGSGKELPLVPVGFAGNVELSLGNAVIINAPQLLALRSPEAEQAAASANETLAEAYKADILGLVAGTRSIGGTTVSISAPYVEIAGLSNPLFAPPPLNTTAALSDATLNINAAFIDLENQVSLQNFGQANFSSSGDIRLSSTDLGSTDTPQPGALYTPGNLTFKAADLYPASDSTFVIDATGPNPTTITFLSNGASNVPLSAGGTLLIDATNIVQSGTIRAPSGTIVLGIGDATDAATQAQFGNLPLTALINTQSVSLTAGSITSVSLDNAVVPYGTTVDGQEWQYNPAPGNPNPDLTAPPPKVITINGSNVALNSGAVIDLSGGGNLQAVEWVPGTGGSRDVLSQYNATFPSTGSTTATPLYPDARNVYAIVPSYQAPVAAYDPIYAQSLQPSKTATGAASSQTVSSGVGQAVLGGAIGQSVYLSGVPGLPAGVYTLLPAKYATLPGAYRVVENTGASNVVPGQNFTMPDGTQLVSGYYVDGLNGARNSTVSQFEVQSASVWQQYSQYTLSSANTFFPAQAISAGNAIPPLPMDAGQLVLAAANGLILNGTLKAAAATGGLAAQVDIASQDIQITGSGAQALTGYLQLSADSLDALGAGSLLIGGTRTQTASGITIDAIANSVVVSNDAGNPLTGPEIILVTKTDTTGTDPNAVNGLRIDSGSVITASGSFNSAASSVTISGNGALVRVSNGGAFVFTRTGLSTTTPPGLLTVGASAVLNGGQSLTLDSSDALNFDATASFSGASITVDAGAITFTNETGVAAAALPGFVIGPNGLAQFANAQQVALRSYNNIGFVGDVTINFAKSVDLSAGGFTSDGGAVVLNAPQISFTNDLGAPVPASVAGAGSLIVNAGEIDFGAGSKTVSGFGSVVANASSGIVGQGTGTFDFGALPVTMNAPVYLADTSSNAIIKTTGEFDLNRIAGTALALSPVGGAINFIGGSLNDNGAIIEAPAGNVSLEATAGDLTIASGALVSSAGVSKQFFDVVVYAPAGAISLVADTGSLNVQAGSILDFSGAQGGGAAGSLTLSAPQQVVNLNGTLKGGAASGYLGGAFSLNTGGAVDLDNLAVELAASGVNDAIEVQTGAGNLVLSAGNTLTAHFVLLTADGGSGDLTNTGTGNVLIAGTINASGQAGGEIDLYGKNNVDIEGSLIATGSSATQRGGTVNIGTTASFDPNIANPYNAASGYENLVTSGGITLGSNALIDVSGGTAGGLTGGTVNFRAPLLANGGVNMVVNAFNANKGIFGSRATTLEAYAMWSTTDATTGAQHFDGLVDPAGWYNSVGPNATPQLVEGTFTDQSGNIITYTPGTYVPANGATAAYWTPATLSNDLGANWTQIKADLANDLANDYFTPKAGYADTAHQQFYGYQSTTTNSDGSVTNTPGTLMAFVQNFQVATTSTNGFANLANANFTTVPGIELDNPSPAINHGNISIVTNWNLGSGASATSPGDFRTLAGGAAPIITFRAENKVEVKASLSDGFFQIANPTAPPLGTVTINPVSQNYTPQSEYNAFFVDPYGNVNGYYAISQQNGRYFAGVLTAPAPASAFTGGDPAQIAQYSGMYQEYISNVTTGGAERSLVAGNSSNFGNAPVAGQPLAPSAPTLGANPTQAALNAYSAAYQLYQLQYSAYVTLLTAWINTANPSAPGGSNGGFAFQVVPPQAPLPVLTPIISAPVTITTGTLVTDNTPSPVATSTNALPLASASLNGGSSTSFRIVAGSNLSSANPLAVQAAALFGNGGGSVTLDGHFGYVDTNNQTINVPTMIRTGTGSIDIAAANDISLLDPIAPGVIYTAGAPATGAPVGTNSSIAAGNTSFAAYDLLVTNAVNSDAAGDISIHAQNDITGIESVIGTGSNGNGPGFGASQFWWQWMQTGNTYAGNQITQSSINFGAFDQGIMSIGGNVSISAGGDITNLAVSLPTTWYLSNNNTVVNTVGGGNLTVAAGGNILSGDYFVASGAGTLTAGGRIGSSGLLTSDGGEVSTLLAAQDGVFNVGARQGVDLGAVLDPSYVQGNTLVIGYGLHADAQSYSATSALNVISTTGNVALNTLANLSLIGVSAGQFSVLPATVDLSAFTGGITVAGNGELYPSATGQLSLIADQSIDIYNAAVGGASNFFGLIDASASAMPSPLNPIPSTSVAVTNEFDGNLTSSALIDHSQAPLHANDTQPVRIYSLTGSIIDGTVIPEGQPHAGFYQNLLQISVDKPALIQAAADIVNLAFLGQNLRGADITSILAGRDISDSRNILEPAQNPVYPSLVLGGPGTFDIEAGRNIGPLYAVSGVTTGIDTVGNADNPYLPHESANLQVLFGTGPGINNQAFVANYIAPDASIPGINTVPDLIAFMEQYDEGLGVDTGLVKDKTVVTLTADQAWAQFQMLPVSVQQLFSEQILFKVLSTVGQDFHDPNSPFFNQYARGYQAINTLFPASFGYTANNLGGGTNGANSLIQTGNLDIRSTTIQTQQGGNVSILGPGGQALIGSSSAPPASGNAAAGQGILTLEQGNVNIFTDQSLLLAQSRVFTEQGGDMTIWSSNGDINAGKGAKTIADVPPPLYVSDNDHYNTLDARGEVTGAGIATLQTIPDSPPGSIFLIAPRGTVDAGAAGIRFSGNLVIAALQVLNANNISGQGTITGLTTVQAPNISGAISANNTSAATQQTGLPGPSNNNGQTSVMIVEIVGYGGTQDTEDNDSDDDKRRRRGQQ